MLGRPQCKGLDCRGLMPHHRIHLRAGELHAHRPVEHLRGKSRKQRVWPDVSLAAETSAEELRDHIDLFLGYTEHNRHEFPGTEDIICRFIKRWCCVAVPSLKLC